MALATASVSHAGNMYIYKDNNGQVLLTNVNPSGNFNKFTQRVKVTYYPESRIQSGGADSSTPTSSASINGYRGFSTPSNSANRNAYDSYIRASAARHGVDPALIKAMMHTESAFNPNARSPVGAQGLMQLMPATARRFSVSNPWNPAENIEGAAKYIAWLTRRFNGNIEHVVAGYNAGEGNVDKYRGIPPFRETQDYVKRVLGRYNNIYRLEFNAAATNTPSQNSTRSAHILPASYATNQVVFSDSQPQPSSYAQSAYAALR
ncbi:lytic transglycosylase domain-containing protein [Psychrobacter sp. I-STPA6b]|uniref:lytic transglycosylase domain-containing protein n=1 Tax=Psychrobacter sp. I-STPA6b TaxID=2585718 RepID=UPI001D0CB588|nr:lytic transglycosylase domain-containing protein [Psychrobacter sp. I-STPA6b]